MYMAKYGRDSISLQSPVTYQFEMVRVQEKTLELVTRKDLPLLLFDIVAIATNGKPILKQSFLTFTFFPTYAMILPVVWSANGDCSAQASSKVNSQNFVTDHN